MAKVHHALDSVIVGYDPDVGYFRVGRAVEGDYREPEFFQSLEELIVGTWGEVAWKHETELIQDLATAAEGRAGESIRTIARALAPLTMT